MKNKSFTYLFLGTVTLAGLTACANSNNANKDDKSGEDSYKITTVRWSDWGEDYHKGFLTDSAKEAGIDVKWDTLVAADWADKKSVLVASGDLPDAFLGSNAFTDSEIAQNQSLFIPLEDLIKENMPNLTKAMEKEPKIKAMITSPDGHIYSLPKKLPMRPMVANQLFINKKWLDNLGLKVPETYDDLVKVLQEFKDKDANGNGDVSDEIPFGAGNFDPTFSYILPFNNRLGADNTYEMSVKDGKPVYLRTEESYKQGIAAMHESYKKGLIDPEIFTEDTSMSVAKRMDKGVSRVGVSSGWTADATFGLHSSEYIALPALKGMDGKQYVFSDPDHYNYGRNEILITNKSKNPAKLLKWLDKLYTDEASIQNFYGSFGIATEKNGDKFKVLPPKDGKSADEWAWIHSLRDFGPKYVSDDINSRVEIDQTQGDGLKLKMDQDLKQFALPAYPNVIYSQEELNKLSSIYVSIESYVKQQASKWVVEGGIEKEWDSYKETLKNMGLDEFMKIQQEAYNRYQKEVKE